ncbi:Ribosomal-protein-alanine N-acetyltransferase [Burkholderiales bacterium 8X]|nr:Ribosomal-protein-alanine N-acetyltransferase [Burkholderiales bacterium 8X]
MIIQLARPLDAAGIAAMSRETIEYGLPWRWTEHRVLRCIRDPETNVIVGLEGDQLAGFAIMKYADTDAHIALFAVSIGLRRSGLGSALLAWLEETAGCCGIRAIRLEARIGNAAARAFYARHGFIEEGRRDGYYEGAEDAVRLVKKLGRLAPSDGPGWRGLGGI